VVPKTNGVETTMVSGHPKTVNFLNNFQHFSTIFTIFQRLRNFFLKFIIFGQCGHREFFVVHWFPDSRSPANSDLYKIDLCSFSWMRSSWRFVRNTQGILGVRSVASIFGEIRFWWNPDPHQPGDTIFHLFYSMYLSGNPILHSLIFNWFIIIYSF